MKKTLLVLLLLLFLVPAAMAEHADTAYYQTEQNGEWLEYPGNWFYYEPKQDGTATLFSLTLSKTAATDMNGTLYLPSKVDDYTITRIDNTILNDIKSRSFIRLVIPETLAEFVPYNEYGMDGILLENGLEEVMIAAQNAAFSMAENRCLLQGDKLVGLFPDTSVTSFAIPEGVKTVDLRLITEAFPNLTDLTLPASLTEFKCNMNQYPPLLERIDAHPDNPVYHTTDGVLFRGTDLYLVPTAYPTTHYTVPEGTESISWYSFFRCEKLTEVTLPESMKRLDPNAFYVCRNLRTINIPAGLTQMAEGAFSFCWNLENIHLAPENPAFSLVNNLLIDKEKNLLLAAVNDGKSLIILPESLRAIGARAFTNNVSMTQVHLNEGLETIGEEAFIYADLTDVSLPSTLKTIAEGAFDSCEMLEEVTFAKGSSALKSLGQYAFAFSAVKRIEFPADCPLKVISGRAFYDCKSLETITLPSGLKEIQEWAFEGCSKLKAIDLPDSITTLGEYCLSSCSSLNSLKLPEGITSFDADVIYGSYAIKYLVIPRHVALPSYLSDTLQRENIFGHGRLVVHRDSDAHQQCRRRSIPYTLMEELPFLLGDLRVTATTDPGLQQFLDAGGSLIIGYKSKQLTITQQTAQGEKSVLQFPCTIREGKLMLDDVGYLDYTIKDINHVELVSNQWIMQLEGEKLP